MNHYCFFTLLSFFLLLATAAFAQSSDRVAAAYPTDSAHHPSVAPTLVSSVDRAPSLTGTQPDVRQWVMQRVHYPELAVENAVEGRVIIAYVVGPDGKITDVRVHQKLGFGCDEAALAAFLQMPQWNPGVRNGRAVAVQCYTPIDFKLQ